MCTQSQTTSTVVLVGNFDGVHRGHQALIAEARRLAENHGRVIVLVFDPHPRFILHPQAAHPPRLSNFALRRDLLLEIGADEVNRLQPTSDLLNQSPREFIEMLRVEYEMTAMMEGADFRFGKNREGDVAMLRDLGSEIGFEVRIVDALEVGLSNQIIVKASSSMVRQMIRMGRIHDAQRILGRHYCLFGEVVAGDRRGRTIGFPTANVRTEYLLPASGVYGGRARRCSADYTKKEKAGEWYPAAVNIGTRPTFGGSEERTCEVHLLDYEGEVGSYGWEIEVEFHTYLRDEIHFPSVQAVIAQIGRDVDRVRTLATI